MTTHFSSALLRKPAAAAALLLAACGAIADDFVFAGNIRFHNDVVQIDFALTGGQRDVTVWTDSWLSGINFDPSAALWQRSGADFTLLQTVDDDDTIAPGQGYYDTGFALPMLAPGNYRLTLVAAVNAPLGTLLSQGFSYGAQTPIPVGQWNQPTYDPNANDQKGSFWRVHVNNVMQASVVPEPAAWLLLLAGVGAVRTAAARSRGRRAD